MFFPDNLGKHNHMMRTSFQYRISYYVRCILNGIKRKIINAFIDMAITTFILIILGVVMATAGMVAFLIFVIL